METKFEDMELQKLMEYAINYDIEIPIGDESKVKNELIENLKKYESKLVKKDNKKDNVNRIKKSAPASWMKIKCTGCNTEKMAGSDRVEKLKNEGKLENYKCRNCRPKKVKD